ncbi:ATP synthase F1 subunit gamma [Peptostreptococcaceae bacterium AGR-M142]
MAGAGMKDIKRRIKSVNSTKKITKAMELVSSSKLRKSKEKVVSTRPYFNAFKESMDEIILNSKGVRSIYMDKREVKNKCYIVVAGDRGLCGGYNSSILKESIKHMNGNKEKIIPVGKRSIEFFTKRDYEIITSISGASENPVYSYGKDIAMKVMDMYKNKDIDEVHLVYTYFKSTLVQEPKVIKLLPLDVPEGLELEESDEITKYEPSPESVLNSLVPSYISSIIYGGIVEASASEHAARRVAMESATDNAQEMIDKLELSYNRARQASITQELTEIVAGADAL